MNKNFQKGALPIKDDTVIQVVSQSFASLNSNDVLTSSTLREDFLTNYTRWLSYSALVELKGISEFKYKSYTHGTIQAFDHFYSEFSHRRFRCFKGDFMYHTVSWRNNYNFLFLEEDVLKYNDAVVISIPFSGNGHIHPDTYRVLKKCDELDIPVLIDLAYVNISNKLTVDLQHKCIHTICFSLSKAFFSIDKLRIGMRLKRKFTDDPVDVFNSINMVNNIGAYIGNELINNFSPDYNYTTYASAQQAICSKYGLQASNCVIFALGNNTYTDFNRGGEYNRICISNILIK